MAKLDRHTQTKREERRTYKDVGLSDALRTKAQRARAERGGAFRVLGGGLTGLPPIAVPAPRWAHVRIEVTRELFLAAQKAGLALDPDKMIEGLQHRIDRVAYDRLAQEMQRAADLESAFTRHHGRQPTRDERRQFELTAQVHATAAPASGCGGSGVRKATRRERTQAASLVNLVLDRIQGRQTHNPARYQSVWAEAAGTEVSQQSELLRVENGIAFFRCYNSALTFHLQRRADLPRKLAQALRVPVRQVKAAY
jgi:hypothetical protein